MPCNLSHLACRYLEVLEGMFPLALHTDGPVSASLQCLRHLPNVSCWAKSGSAVRSRTDRSDHPAGQLPTPIPQPVRLGTALCMTPCRCAGHDRNIIVTAHSKIWRGSPLGPLSARQLYRRCWRKALEMRAILPNRTPTLRFRVMQSIDRPGVSLARMRSCAGIGFQNETKHWPEFLAKRRD
jgi:hypothetical protein